MKRKFAIAPLALALALLAGCAAAATANTSAPNAVPAMTAAQKPLAVTQSTAELVVKLTDTAQIRVVETEGGTLSFTGSAERYKYTVSGPASGVTTVEIQAKNDSGMRKDTLTVPQGAYGVIRVEASGAAVSLTPKAAHYALSAEDCAVAVTISSAYTGRLTTDVTGCAVSVTLGGPPPKITLSLSTKDCAISAPQEWKVTPGTFALTRGTGGATLNLTCRDSAVNLRETNLDFTSRYEGTSACAYISSREDMLLADGEDTWLTGGDDRFIIAGGVFNGKTLEQVKAAHTPNTITEIKTLPAAGITTLCVNTNLCAVVLEPAQSGAFELAYQGVDKPGEISVTTEIKDGVLTVTAEGTGNMARYLSTAPDVRVNCVRVGVPAGVLTSLQLDCGAGMITSNGLPLPAVTGVAAQGAILLCADAVPLPVTMGSGNGSITVEAERVSAPVTLSAENGSVEVDAGTTTGKLTLAAANGHVDVKADTLGDADLTAKNGSVSATVGTVAGNASFTALNGSVETTFDAIAGSAVCSVANGTLEAALTRRPTDLTFHITGGWSAQMRDDDWGHGDSHPTGLPVGWYDGLALGNGKPSLTLGAAVNGDLSFTVPEK